MGEHNVHLDSKKGFLSDGKIARIDDSGRILVPSTWFSEKVVAYLRDDGIYVSGPGLFSMRCVARIKGNRIYSTVDEGFLTMGKLIGSIDDDGTIRDELGRKVGDISGGSPLVSETKKEEWVIVDPPGPSIGLLIAILLLPLSVVSMVQIAWTSSMSVFNNPISFSCLLLFAIAGTIAGVNIVRDKKADGTFGKVFARSKVYYYVAGILFIVLVVIFDGGPAELIEYHGGLYGWILAFVGCCFIMPLFAAVVALPVLAVQVIVTVIAKRAQREKP